MKFLAFKRFFSSLKYFKFWNISNNYFQQNSFPPQKKTNLVFLGDLDWDLQDE